MTSKKYYRLYGIAAVALSMSITSSLAQQQAPLWTSRQYSIFSDRVVQGTYVAKALSNQELISNYKSPANEFQSTKIAFKFSINGKDNEMLAGVDHHFNLLPGVTETPLVQFGTALKDATGETGTYLSPGTRLKVRVDMKAVLSDFKTKGFYTTFKGDKIYKEDFKGLYVAGNTLPMIWDFDNLHTKEGLELTDKDGDGIYETDLILNAQKDEKQTDASWRLSKDISAFSQYHSGNVLADAIYNMSLEEMVKAVEPDSTFRTGKEWAGVWTRDISYSIILSMAHLQPEVAKKSLRKKVNKKKKIIQDTGTGGAYPCSTDRMIWATAAWEIYKATGDQDWLQEAYTNIKNSVEDDMANAYDPATGLVKGESSFLDWREQTYPKWMQPADIFESENLGTNAVHFNANQVLAQMATILGRTSDAARFKANAAAIKKGINQHLWMGEAGYYGQYVYGRNFKQLSPRAEALGEALCVWFGIADATQQRSVISKTPVTDFGITCIYPQIPDIAPYHNNAVWPFVQSYWALAAAKSGNEAAVMESIAAIYRPAALFLTNKENFVADNGDFAGTVINSSNMLWSLSGNLAMVQKLIFGIDFQADHLLLHPFVPQALNGKRSLTNFKYRTAILDIELEGFGDGIQSFLLDGKPVKGSKIPATLTGKHTISIVLNNAFSGKSDINKIANLTTPATPVVALVANELSWQEVANAKGYAIYKNGQLLTKHDRTSMEVPGHDCAEYQVIAFGQNGTASFASEPVFNTCNDLLTQELEQTLPTTTYGYKGFSGTGFIETSTTVNPTFQVKIDVPVASNYAIRFRYANGNGPVNTENKCAIRTLSVNRKFAGTIVLPQRGKDEWSNWGFTNAVQVNLPQGIHSFTLSLEPANDNMNEAINQAMLDYIELIKLPFERKQ